MSTVDRPTAELIGQLPLFSGLSEQERSQLASLATLETHAAGRGIFREGDPPGDLYIVLTGRVTLCMNFAGQGEICFLTLRDGEILGWSGLLRRSRVTTARATEQSTLLRLRSSELLELCETDNRVGYAVMTQAFEEIADRLQDTRLQMLDMFGKSES